MKKTKVPEAFRPMSRVLRGLLLGLALQSVCPGAEPDAAELFQEGRNLYLGKEGGKDLAKAREVLGQSARLGDVRAKTLVAFMMAQGLGGAKDPAGAVGFFREAAEAGNAEACVNLGAMLESGTGTGKDAAAAAGWYAKAADAGSLHGHAKLGELLYFGDTGVPQDYAKALPHLTAAAEGKNAISANLLGSMHEFGQGVKADRTTALKHYEAAARYGYVKAQANLGRLLSSGTPSEQDAIAAYGWLKLASLKGDTMGAVTLANVAAGLDEEQKKEAEERFAALVRTIEGFGIGSGAGR